MLCMCANKKKGTEKRRKVTEAAGVSNYPSMKRKERKGIICIQTTNIWRFIQEKILRSEKRGF